MTDSWTRVVEHTWLRDADHHFFRFSEVPSEERDGGLSVVHDQDVDVVISGSLAAQALNDVCVALSESRPYAVSPSDLTVYVMRHAAAVKRAKGDDISWDGLVKQFESWVSGSVVAVPLGGIFSSLPRATILEETLLAGHLSRETEEAIAALAVRRGLHGFRFTSAWWTELFLGAEADGDFAAELAQEEDEEGTWQPLVLAVTLPAVGIVASYRAICVAEAFLGAVMSLHEPQPAWYKPMPWVLGQATFAENPRSPTLNDDGSLPAAPIQVDSLPDHRLHGYSPMEDGRPAPDLDLAVALEDASTLAVLTSIARASTESNSSDARLIAACRMAFAATHHSLDIGLPLLDQAMDVLMPTGAAGSRGGVLSVDDAFEQSADRWNSFRALLISECTSG